MSSIDESALPTIEDLAVEYSGVSCTGQIWEDLRRLGRKRMRYYQNMLTNPVAPVITGNHVEQIEAIIRELQHLFSIYGKSQVSKMAEKKCCLNCKFASVLSGKMPCVFCERHLCNSDNWKAKE